VGVRAHAGIALDGASAEPTVAEERPMPDKPTWKQRIRGLTGAGLLAVVCVCVSAVFIAWKDPFPIYS